MKQAYWDWNLDLLWLSAENTAVHLNKEFILIDNFDESPEQANANLEFVNHPVKLSFTIAIFCLAGRMSVQINLQEFELRANDILIVLEGAIGEYRGMSDDTRIAVIAFASEYFQTALQTDATMSLQRRLYASPICHLTSAAMEETMAIYHLMKAKIAETDNPFDSTLNDEQIAFLAEGINDVKMFNVPLTADDLTVIFAGKPHAIVRSNNNRLVAFFFAGLSDRGLITPNWQSVIANYKLFLSKDRSRDKYITQSDLSTATNYIRDIGAEGKYATIERYLKQVKKL